MESSSITARRRIHPALLIGAAVIAIVILYFVTATTESSIAFSIQRDSLTARPTTTTDTDTNTNISSVGEIIHAAPIPLNLSIEPAYHEEASAPIVPNSNEQLRINSSYTTPTPPVQVQVLPDENKLPTREDDKLDKILKSAAMKGRNTVILVPLNSAWAEPGSILDFFLEGFRNGNGTVELLKHVIMVCLDHKAYARCKSMHLQCFALTTKGVDFSGDKVFMSSGYLQMVWTKIDFLRVVLEKGYNFIFTDADILWFRNPFPNLDEDADFQVSSDHYIGDPTSLHSWANTGFKYVKSNNRSIALYKYWYSSRESHPGIHDQDALNLIKYDAFISQIGVQIRFLSSEYFGGFCEPSMDLNKVVTMHVNCCAGLKTKIHDLRMLLEDWKKYISLEYSRRISRPYSWSLLQYYCG